MNAFLAFSLRTCRENLQDWPHTVFRLVFQPLVYLLVFGKVLNPIVPGGGYAAVVAPGILSMLVMNASLGVIGGILSRGYYFRSMEGWLLAPLSLTALMLAWVAGAVLAAVVAGLVGAVLIDALLGLAPVFPWTALACLIYGAAVFALLGIIGYTLPQTPAKAQELMSFLLLPMMFLGCTFFSYAMLTPPWNAAALLLPTTYLSEALRAAYSSEPSSLDAMTILAGGVSAFVLLFAVARYVFVRRFRDFLW